MNLLQIAQRVHRESLRSGSGPAAIATATKDHLRIFDAINDVYREIQMMDRSWRWMRASLDSQLSVGPVSYTGAALGASSFGRWRLPTDEYTVRAYDPANPTSVWRLTFVDYDRFVREVVDGSPAAGAPRLWSISPSEALMIGPASDGDYFVKADYVADVQELAADGDTPTMPARHHMTLVWGALKNMAVIDAAPEIMARAAENYDTALDALIQDQAERITITARPLS